MADNFLFIVDPLDRLNPKTDTSLALMQESRTRGINTFACELKDIFLKDGKVHFLAGEVKLEPGYLVPPTYLFKQAQYSADDFKAVFMRKDPPVDESYIASLLMLRCFDEEKTLMINHPDGLLLANEKLFGQRVLAKYFSPTLVSCDPNLLEEFIREYQRVVLKPLFGFGGAGILVADWGDKNLWSMLELSTANFSKPIIAQAYIKDAVLGDKRIILLGGAFKGALNRLPCSIDHRTNFRSGGREEACEITPREHEIISVLGPELMKLGLHFVGIDTIDGFLTEINVTSPTCVIEIEHIEGKVPRLRAEIIDHVLQMLEAKEGQRKASLEAKLL